MARLLLETRALFQHIPRTGGTWVERAIDLCGIPRVGWLEKQPKGIPKKHALLSHYYRDQLASVRYVFTFVRHPIAYYESVWKWLDRIEAPGREKAACQYRPTRNLLAYWRWHPHNTAARNYDPDFNLWVSRMLRNDPLWCTRLYEQYVGPKDGEICNYIGRTETLLEDFCHVLIELGYGDVVEQHSKDLSSSPRRNVAVSPIQWKPEIKEKVLATERLAIERFYGKDTYLKRIYHASVDTFQSS